MDALDWDKIDEVAPELTTESYLTYLAVGLTYFVSQHIVLHLILSAFYKDYQKLETKKMHEYRTQYNSMIHGVMSTAASVYCCFYTCGEGKTFYNDEECRMVPRNCHVWTMFFTGTYLFVDSFVQLFLLGLEVPLDRQTLAHHVLGFTSILTGVVPMNFLSTSGVALFFLEVSTFFVVLRWLLFHHGYKGSVLQNINTVFLCFTFFLGRVFVQLIILFCYSAEWYIEELFFKEGKPAIYSLLLVYAGLCVIVNLLMNLYWSNLIIQQVRRILMRGSAVDTTYTGEVQKDDAKANGSVELASNHHDDENGHGKQPSQEKKVILDPSVPQSDERS